MVADSNKGPRGLDVPAVGTAWFERSSVEWSNYFSGAVIAANVRYEIEAVLRGYHANCAFACHMEPLQDFASAALGLLSCDESEGDWQVLRAVIMLTPDYKVGEQDKTPLLIDEERVALAIARYRTIPDQVRYARRQIRSDEVQDIVPFYREIDAFNTAVRQIYGILTVNGLEPSLSHTRVEERMTKPTDFETFICDHLRDNGYSPASLKQIYNALKTKR